MTLLCFFGLYLWKFDKWLTKATLKYLAAVHLAFSISFMRSTKVRSASSSSLLSFSLLSVSLIINLWRGKSDVFKWHLRWKLNSLEPQMLCSVAEGCNLLAIHMQAHPLLKHVCYLCMSSAFSFRCVSVDKRKRSDCNSSLRVLLALP